MSMATNPDLRVVRNELLRHFERGVGRTVIDNQDLEIGRQLTADLKQLAHMVA
jgi:hypothetical protein